MAPLIAGGAAWVIVLTVLLLDLSGLRRRGRHMRWHAAGALVLMTGLLASEFAVERGWPQVRNGADGKSKASSLRPERGKPQGKPSP
ncbi:MAG TPA: hypothetical protein VII22_14140 [Streptosporangiaceae bacterium]